MISFLQFIYDLPTISCVVQKYYEWLLVTCKEGNKNIDAIGKNEEKNMESATYTINPMAPEFPFKF